MSKNLETLVLKNKNKYLRKVLTLDSNASYVCQSQRHSSSLIRVH